MKKLVIASLIAATALTTACTSQSQKNAGVPAPTGTAEVTLPGKTAPVNAAKTIQIDSRMPSILRADSASYYGKTAEMVVPVSFSDYFNYAYMDAEPTHYSFEVGGNWDNIYAYGSREEFKPLFDYIVQNGGEAVVKVTVTTSADHGDNAIWTLVSWEKVG